MTSVSLDALGAIQSALQWVFNEIFIPVLKDVFNVVFYTVGDMLHEVFAGLLLQGWVALLKVLNFMESIFNIFSGYTQIKVDNVSSNQGIVQYLFSLDVVQRSVMLVTMISFVLAFISTGVAVIKSMADSIGDNKKPISTVLREAFKVAVIFMLIPFTCMFAIEMITQILIQINTALALGNSSATLGDTLFYIIAQPCGKRNGYQNFASGRRFENIAEIEKYFDFMKFDFLVAYIATFFLMAILLTTVVQFIQRLLMIMILYVVSPLFAARMPLDEGKSFKLWKDAFVAFLISAFSPIVAMRLYLMTLPVLIGNDIKYPAGIEPTFLKLLLIIGGSYAIYTSRNMIVKIYNPSLGDMLDANSFMTNFVVGKISKQLQSMIGGKQGGGMQPLQQAGGNGSAGGNDKDGNDKGGDDKEG